MLVDNMKNTFHNTYEPWPFRFYFIHHGKVVLKAEPDQADLAYD
jgi:hypothetical protein